MQSSEVIKLIVAIEVAEKKIAGYIKKIEKELETCQEDKKLNYLLSILELMIFLESDAAEFAYLFVNDSPQRKEEMLTAGNLILNRYAEEISRIKQDNDTFSECLREILL